MDDVFNRLSRKSTVLNNILPLTKPNQLAKNNSLNQNSQQKVSYNPGSAGIKKSRMIRARSGGRISKANEQDYLMNGNQSPKEFQKTTLLKENWDTKNFRKNE